jgi:GxxExxY protein
LWWELATEVTDGVGGLLSGAKITRDQIATLLVKCFCSVYNEMGYGFLEKNYENALVFELRSYGLFVQQQQPITVFYKNHPVGEYFADLLVENCIMLNSKRWDIWLSNMKPNCSTT